MVGWGGVGWDGVGGKCWLVGGASGWQKCAPLNLEARGRALRQLWLCNQVLASLCPTWHGLDLITYLVCWGWYFWVEEDNPFLLQKFVTLICKIGALVWRFKFQARGCLLCCVARKRIVGTLLAEPRHKLSTRAADTTWLCSKAQSLAPLLLLMDCQHMFLRQANSKIGALLSFFGPAWQPNQQSKSSTDNMRERLLFNQMVQVHIKYYCGETFYMELQTLNVRLLTKARKPTGLDRAFLWCTLALVGKNHGRWLRQERWVWSGL